MTDARMTAETVAECPGAYTLMLNAGLAIPQTDKERWAISDAIGALIRYTEAWYWMPDGITTNAWAAETERIEALWIEARSALRALGLDGNQIMMVADPLFADADRRRDARLASPNPDPNPANYMD